MKFKKTLASLLVGAMALSLAACTPAETGTTGETGGETVEGKEKLVVWTLAADLEQFAERFEAENPNVDVETVIIEPANYLTKTQAAVLGGETEPDIIVGEPQMLDTMFDAGMFEDLNQAPYNAQDYADQIVDYVWEVGQDDDGIQRAISYQITPAGIYYRRDIATEVFGTDDPAEVSKLFESYDTILETGLTLNDAGYRVFASDGEMSFFSGNDPWVVDGKLNVSQSRYDYLDLSVELYQQDLTAYASPWSAPWYQGMSGPVPILSADTNVWDQAAIDEAAASGDSVEIFAYGLPSWGVLTMRDNVKDTSGLWGVAAGPSTGFGGGTYIGISANSERKDLAWEFVQFATLDADTMEWWLVQSEGDTVSHIPTLEAHADDTNEVYGGQQLYSFWLEQAANIDYSVVTEYDTAIGLAWNTAIEAVKREEKSREDAINEFYDMVEATYPEIEVVRD